MVKSLIRIWYRCTSSVIDFTSLYVLDSMRSDFLNLNFFIRLCFCGHFWRQYVYLLNALQNNYKLARNVKASGLIGTNIVNNKNQSIYSPTEDQSSLNVIHA